MFSKFKTDLEILFLDPDLELQPKGGKAAVILSPALYWVRGFDLPLQNEKEAKKLLPTLFEDFLPDGEFRYFGYFQNGRYIGFAFEEEKIRTLLAQKGVELANVETFHFAQSELDKEALPAKLDDKWMLADVEGIVVKLPLLDPAKVKPLELTTKKLSPKTVKIERYATPVATKTLYMLSTVFLLFGVLYGLQWFRIEQETVHLQKRSDEIFKKYALMPTMTQNKSILKKYETIDAKQKKIRKIIAALLKVAHTQKNHLRSLNVREKSVHAVFGDMQHQNALIQPLQAFKPRIRKLKNGAVSVEVAL